MSKNNNLVRSLIQHVEENPTSINQLSMMVDSHTRVIPYDEILQKSNADINELFDSKCNSLIILLRIRDRNVGHFVLLNYDESTNTYNYWDPYGFSLSYGLMLCGDTQKTLLNMLKRVQLRCVSATQACFTENKYQYQTLSKRISTCGLHCVIRNSLRFIDENDYRSYILSATKNKHIDDFIVEMCMLDLIRISS